MHLATLQGVIALIFIFRPSTGMPINGRLMRICNSMLDGLAEGASIPEINACKSLKVTACPPIDCGNLTCSFGFKKDGSGCQVCECDNVYGGDVWLTPDQQLRMQANLGLVARHGSRGYRSGTHRWTDNVDAIEGKYVIPYTFTQGMDPDTISTINAALGHIANRTCLEFRQWLFDFDDYIKFNDEPGCYSHLGRIGGEQTIQIGRGCATMDRVLHELLHSLGLWHEHTRTDRDQNVRVLWRNVDPDQYASFLWNEVFDSDGAYDVTSVMQYGSYAFSWNGEPTMTDRNGTVLPEVTRNELSPSDVDRINELYECDILAMASKTL